MAFLCLQIVGVDDKDRDIFGGCETVWSLHQEPPVQPGVLPWRMCPDCRLG